MKKMSSKELEEIKRTHKLLVLVELLIQEIDNPYKEPTPLAKNINNKAKELQELLIPILDMSYKYDNISNSTLSQTMQNKFEYIFNKEFK